MRGAAGRHVHSYVRRCMRSAGNASRVALKYEWHYMRGMAHDERCAMMEYTRQVLAVCQAGTVSVLCASLYPLCPAYSPRRTVGGYMLPRTRWSES
jgi:hypothetical protein